MNDVEKVPFYHQVDFNKVNNGVSWASFSEKLNITNQHAKIENFKLTIDKNHNVVSLTFDVIDKVNNEFNIYHYNNCFSCEYEEENHIRISKNTVNEWVQYDRLINAKEFFSKLDILQQERFFKDIQFEKFTIYSSGWYEGIGLEGDYFTLDDRTIQKIDIKPNMHYEGFNLWIRESNRPSNVSSEIETQIVFIANFREEKRDEEKKKSNN